MAGTATKPKSTVVVAISFDDQTAALTATAVSLARRFDVELRFVHTVPSNIDLTGLDYSSSLFVYPGAVALSNDEIVKEAYQRLEDEVLATLPPDVRRSGMVATGFPVQCVIAEAVASRASLILTGCDPAGYKAGLAGLSTPIGLMHEAPLPVLVVSSACPIEFTKEGFRILIADDLQPSTMEATRKGYELAMRLGPHTRVRHLYVHGDPRELDHEVAAGTTLLGGQGQPWRSAAEAKGVAVTMDIRCGSVSGELHKATIDGEPDLLVFGRHRVLRTRPFLIGRMPLRAMLLEKRAVLLVPSAQELYSRQPFPSASSA